MVSQEGRSNRVTRWTPGAYYGEVVVGGNGRGDDLNQLNGPAGLLLVKPGQAKKIDWEGGRCEGGLNILRVVRYLDDNMELK